MSEKRLRDIRSRSHEKTASSPAENSVPKLLVVCVAIFSLVALPSVLTQTGPVTTVPLAHATCLICFPPPQWTPAGPAMNTELAPIFTDDNAEFLSITSPTPGIDMMDWPLTPAQTNTLAQSSSTYFVTQPIAEHGLSEVEFDGSNNFWSCSFNFASSPNIPGAPLTDCSANIRRAISHLIDKNTFTSTDSAVHGKSIAIDNPVPPSDGLVGPNPCPTDVLYPGTSATNCVTTTAYPGPTGGISFNCATEAALCPTGSGAATGQCGTEAAPAACDFPWMRPFGSADFCAAAQYLVTAGLATGMDNNCVLTGVSSAVMGRPINFFVRDDIAPRFHIGTGMAETICALFTGGYQVGCISGTTSGGCLQPNTTSFPADAILCVTEGPITTFLGFTTCKSSIGSCPPKNDWWMYTAGYQGVFPFDSILYHGFNSQFVSAPPTPSPCASTTTSAAASNYDYVCNPTYDTWSSAMEFPLCAGVAGDPVAGSSSNAVAGTCSGAAGTCPSTPTACSAVSAGFNSELLFMQGAFEIPVYSQYDTFVYLPNWNNIVNSAGAGLPNFYTWLNAWSQTPAVAGTIRQGFEQTTSHLSPYTASSQWDFYILGNVMDSLFAQNPLNNNQLIDWMTKYHSFVANGSLGYSPPAGTTVTLRAVLRNDIFFHNGQKVTASDVAFSYTSMLLNGAFQASPIIGLMTGVTVLSSTNFDINLKAKGPFTELTIGGMTIFPGSLWYAPSSGCPASWSTVLSSPTPATYPTISSNCLNTSSAFSASTFDPVNNGVLVGSGPWVCQKTGATTGVPVGTVGTGCSTTNTQSPPTGATFTLTRFGCTLGSGGTTCVAPNTTASLQSQYFRSSANLARWFWSGNTGSVSHDLVNIATLTNCFNKALGTAGCTHWQQGIGAPGGSAIVGLSQISSVSRFYLLNWTSPFPWTGLVGIAVGSANSFDGIPAPQLQENDPLLPGSMFLYPASVAGCNTATPYPAAGSGYDC